MSLEDQVAALTAAIEKLTITLNAGQLTSPAAIKAAEGPKSKEKSSAAKTTAEPPANTPAIVEVQQANAPESKVENSVVKPTLDDLGPLVRAVYTKPGFGREWLAALFGKYKAGALKVSEVGEEHWTAIKAALDTALAA